MKGDMSVASTRLPSSALTFTASGRVAISSRPSPGTCEFFDHGIPWTHALTWSNAWLNNNEVEVSAGQKRAVIGHWESLPCRRCQPLEL